MDEKTTIEATIDNIRFAEVNCHRCPAGDIDMMLVASAEIRNALETFSGHRSSVPPEAGGVPEARANFIAAREAAHHLLGSAGHDMNVIGNIEAATRELRLAFPL